MKIIWSIFGLIFGFGFQSQAVISTADSGQELSLRLGTVYEAYRETGLRNQAQLAGVAKFKYKTPNLPKRWQVESNGQITGASIADQGESFHTVRMSVRAGRTFNPKDPIQMSLQGGVAYTNLIAEARAFGYKDLFGPQIRTEAKGHLGDSRFITLGFQYTFLPMNISFPIFRFNDFHVGADLGYEFRLKSGNPVFARFEYFQQRFEVLFVTSQLIATQFEVGFGF